MNETFLVLPSIKDVLLSMPLKTWVIFSFSILISILFKFLEYYLPSKEFKYFLKRYKVEFFTFIFAILGYSVSYMFIGRPGTAFILGIVITIVSLLVIVYSKDHEKDFYFLPFKKNGEKEEWMGDGKFGYERIYDAFAITESDSGFIFSKSLTWSDYFINFEFKILHSSLGVILRATNLSNLIMMQIFQDKIKPHIRINGFWKWWEEKDVNLSFEKKLNLDNWYKCSFHCDKRSIKMNIYTLDGEILLDREWRIPSGNISFLYPNHKDIELAPSIPFAINLEHGTFGFRNNEEEKALVRNVLIEKIQGNKKIKQEVLINSNASL